MTEEKKMPNYVKFIIGGASGMTGLLFVQPMDLVKTRMQMAGIGGKESEYKNSLDCLMKVLKNEGLLKCWHGLGAGLLRQATYTTARMGVYQNLIEAYKSHTQHAPTVPASMGMGIMAGAVGAFVGNPADVALIRMVTDGKLPPAERRNYKNVADALTRILKEEGLPGLWKGCLPTVGRAMIVNMCQLASYSQAKNYLQKGPLQMKEGFGVHVGASSFSGLLTSIASLPMDIAKTRIQNMKTAPGAKPEYSGTIDVLVRVCRNEGPLALWKGFTPYFARLTPLTILIFVFLEQYNKLYYKYVLGTEGGSSL
ncbi:mitochondrial 2-oxoglutarate/malate carrier protein-like [Lucilia cuprina]|uniref:mitochondrial 2-oxoglutarate/malate carrier protein-like n=1 Tax=Lucilia cuprina TaxID=7375 RepID=UPI001F0631AE|nr:mitochondrial 2-oxoglutarate/malate carrier protein-like [Lucilia cuprina]